MSQKFNKKDFEKLQKKLKINQTPSQIDVDYINKTKKYIKLIKWIPWLKMIAVWNSIWMNASKKDSDIDLFIVTSPNRMWLVRFLISIIFQVLWVRKTEKKHAWRFCLSFFCTTDWMNFSNFAIEKDIYLYFWIVYLKPILDYDDTFSTFIKIQTWADFSDYEKIIKENKKYITFSK